MCNIVYSVSTVLTSNSLTDFAYAYNVFRDLLSNISLVESDTSLGSQWYFHTGDEQI